MPQPFPLLGDWLMHSPLHLLLDSLAAPNLAELEVAKRNPGQQEGAAM
jgi:hypothetical protein